MTWSTGGHKIHSLWLINVSIPRTIVVHELEDDLGLGTGDQLEGSQKTGNAGARLDCCIIKWTNGATNWMSAVSVTVAVISAAVSLFMF